MTINAAEIVTPQRTYVYLGDLGAMAPLDATTPLDPEEWRNVGHTTEDSLTFSTEPNFEEVRSAQSDYVVRRFQTSDAATVAVDLLQWSATNFRAVFGGGTVTKLPDVEGKPPTYKFVPPRLTARKDLSCVIEAVDGDKHYRFVFPKCTNTEGVELALQKGSSSNLALSLSILGGDGVDSWYLLVTGDPSFDPENLTLAA